MRGKLITFEGSEGCGKSTQIEQLVAWLRSHQIEALALREPGGTPLCETIRHLLKHDPVGKGMTPEAELLLFTASRAELVRKVIEPALASGQWIVCDRFYDSTTVYQGYARGLDLDLVKAINTFALGTTRADLTLVLNVSPEEAKRRVIARSTPDAKIEDRMESEPDEFYLKVRDGYRKLSEEDPKRVRWIEASGTREEVFAKIKTEVQHAFRNIVD